MVDFVECIVVGAGVVGLAIARSIAGAGQETLVLERESLIGSITSSRNSEVIHAGIYYPKDSLKAKLCVAGKQMLYDYCQTRHIPHRQCGKLIVATNTDQLAELNAIKEKASNNGVADLSLLSKSEALELEPSLNCVGALLSPSTGIIDSHVLMQCLQGDLEAAGGTIACGNEVVSAQPANHGFTVQVRTSTAENSEDEVMELSCKLLINSTGLNAVSLAHHIASVEQLELPTAYYAKGNYFSLQSKAPFNHLIYPVPEPGGLGVHLTLDMGGQAKFGPDVEWIDSINYDVDPARGKHFYAEIRKYWPDLQDHSLVPAYSGIRPKISGPGEPAADFQIQGPEDHGIPGLVQLFGIESPGLTASLAIAEIAKLKAGIT